MPIRSNPWCLKNRRSSADRNAAGRWGGIRSSAMIRRFSIENEPTSSPSADSTVLLRLGW